MHRTLAIAAVALATALPAFAAPAAPPAAAPAPAPAQAEGAAAQPAWQGMIDAFFASVAAGEEEKAVDNLYQEYPFRESLGDQVEQLKTNFVQLADAVGSFRGQDRLAVQQLSDRFVYTWYLAYFDRQPLQIHFSFYKPKDRWVIYQFSYDQGVVDVAREMARRRVAESGLPGH